MFQQWRAMILVDPLTFKSLLKAFHFRFQLPYDRYQNAGIRRRFCWSGHGEQWRWNWAGHVLRRQNVFFLFDEFCTFASSSGKSESRADGGSVWNTLELNQRIATKLAQLNDANLRTLTCAASPHLVEVLSVWTFRFTQHRIRRLLVTLVSNVLPSKMVPWTCFRQFRLAATSRDRLQIWETKIWKVDIGTIHSSLQQFANCKGFCRFSCSMLIWTSC